MGEQVGYTTSNRKPSILYIHNTLCRNISHNGHDNRRPRIGVAIHYTTEKGKERLRKDPPHHHHPTYFQKSPVGEELDHGLPGDSWSRAQSLTTV